MSVGVSDRCLKFTLELYVERKDVRIGKFPASGRRKRRTRSCFDSWFFSFFATFDNRFFALLDSFGESGVSWDSSGAAAAFWKRSGSRCTRRDVHEAPE